MKLAKEEIQKAVLGGILCCALLYAYYEYLLTPIKRRGVGTRAFIVATTSKLNDGKRQVKKTQGMEASVVEAEKTLKQVQSMIPDGAPVAWYPPRITEFFKRNGIDKTTTRMTNESPDKALTGFRRLNWGIDIPRADFVTIGNALAAFENEEPLTEILSVQIETASEDIETQRLLLSVRNIVKQ